MLRTLVAFALVLFSCDSPTSRPERPVTPADLGTVGMEKLELSLKAQWLHGPFGNIEQDNQLLVIVRNAAGAPVSLEEGLVLSFFSTMPSMGHPMEDAGYFEEIGTGVYLNKFIRFNMPGDWQHELWVMDSEWNIIDQVIWNEFF